MNKKNIDISSLIKWDDMVVEQFKNDPVLATECLRDELDEYAKTGEIQYLLLLLKNICKAKGFTWLSKETGLSRPCLYEFVNGASNPRLETVSKIMKALGFRMLFVTLDNKELGPSQEQQAIAL